MVRLSRRSLLRTSGGALTVGLAGCTGTESASTPTATTASGQEQSQEHGTVASYKYDPARTGVAGTALPGENPTETWTTDPEVQNAIIMKWAAVDADRVYAAILTFGHFPAAVVAFDRETGAVQWKHDSSGSVPALAGDTLYIADDRVRALAATDGSERWVAAPAPERGFGAPAVVDDTVYAASREAVYAFDAADGSVRWSNDQGIDSRAPVTVADGTVYTVHSVQPGVEDNEIVAIDATDGTELWRQSVRNGVVAAPAVTNGVVYVSDYRETVYAIETADGTERWRQQVGDEPSSPTVANGRAYVRTKEAVVALAAEDGALDWQRSAHRVQSFRYPVTLTDDALLVSGGTALAVHDPRDGTKRYELPVAEDRGLSGATVVDGTIYVGGTVSGEFGVYALGN